MTRALIFLCSLICMCALLTWVGSLLIERL
ncbi:hypothetical protein BGLT_02223 [Caballeronia glathei]|nr:hypothetical protein BGLT_02223 [Caballeronia glathei]